MRNRTSVSVSGEARLMDTEELRMYTNLGRNNAVKLGEDIGAKTQFINLLSAMLGNDKTANVPIQNMNEESKFALGEIVGKRLINVGDQTSSEIKDSSIFKQLTGGDEIKCEKKGKQPFNYRYDGGIIIACNNLPTFTDDKGGHLFERLCIVPCTNTIARERRDVFLLDKMLKEKEVWSAHVYTIGAEAEDVLSVMIEDEK